jgi:hypothetical protein
MQISQIQIKHPSLGEIVINTSIPDFIQERIGDVVEDYSKGLQHYHAEVSTENKELFSIKNLCLISYEPINIGWMQNSKGNKNFITVITNKLVCENIDVYSAGVISVNYCNE